MKEFCCGDVVPGCTARFHGSEEDILAAVAVHAREDHGVEDISPELVAQVRAHIVDA